jgi:hypothetical protein
LQQRSRHAKSHKGQEEIMVAEGVKHGDPATQQGILPRKRRVFAEGFRHDNSLLRALHLNGFGKRALTLVWAQPSFSRLSNRLILGLS